MQSAQPQATFGTSSGTVGPYGFSAARVVPEDFSFVDSGEVRRRRRVRVAAGGDHKKLGGAERVGRAASGVPGRTGLMNVKETRPQSPYA